MDDCRKSSRRGRKSATLYEKFLRRQQLLAVGALTQGRSRRTAQKNMHKLVLSREVAIKQRAKSIDIAVITKVSLRYDDRVAWAKHQKEVVSDFDIPSETGPADCSVRCVRHRFEAILEELQMGILIRPDLIRKVSAEPETVYQQDR